MSTPYPKPKPNETTRMKRIQNTHSVDDSIKARLPHVSSGIPPAQPPPPPTTVYAASSPEYRSSSWSSRFLPAFWTIASVISLIVNVILFTLLLIAFRMLGDIRTTTEDQVSGLLGGLYENFVRMEEATINRTIPVDANIPINIMVPIQNVPITLSQPADIRNVRVVIDMPGFHLDSPRTRVILPAGTPLVVNFNSPLPVSDTIPVHLDVPVNIPLRETQLREPFQGLQQVVRPWYCLVEPNAFLNGQQVCSPIVNPPAIETVTP
jgi:hypothetical protein